MEYTKEQVLRLADSLENCADPKRGCGECMFDKTCDRDGETGCAVLREAAKVIREMDEALQYLTAVNAHMKEMGAKAGDPSASLRFAQDDGRGWAWQVGLYERAIDRFGAGKQVTKAVEEMGELIVELSRWQIEHQTEDKHLLAQIREELADVCIMCDQLQLIFGDVSDWEMYKLERLERRLEKGL